MTSSHAIPTGSRRDNRAARPRRRQPGSSPSLVMPIGDGLAIAMALAASFLLLRYGGLSDSRQFAGMIAWSLAVPLFLVWQLSLAAMGSYGREAVRGTRIPVQRITLATLLTFGTLAIVEIVALDTLPAELFSVTLPLGLLFILGARILVRRMSVTHARESTRFRPHMVLCADSESGSTKDLFDRHGRDDLHIVGRISADEALSSDSPIRYILKELIEHDAGTLLVSPFSGINAQQAQSLRWLLEGANIRMSFLLPVSGVSGQRMLLRAGIKPAIIDLMPGRYCGWYFLLKRLLDIVLAGLGILALLPVAAVVALSIKLSDGGPVFFSQVRVGQHGCHFRMHKFRTMRTDAEAALQEMREKMGMSPDCGNEILFKLKCDPRITRVGGFLRRYSIDELPQLVNVLLGDMTLIGPRPPLPREVANYEPDVLRKFLVKPGLTGLWQTMGRSNLSWKDSVYLDLYYVENCSPLLDLRILVRTFKAVLSKEGAY